MKNAAISKKWTKILKGFFFSVLMAKFHPVSSALDANDIRFLTDRFNSINKASLSIAAN